jgi:cytochrome d ubiquinol oxidase subunit II
VSFSGFYLAMFVILIGLILRPVAFKYRSKNESPAWRSRWDWALFAGSFIPALICGVAMGNVLQGVPFRLTPELYIHYDGSFFGLLNPFAILAGLISVSMLLMHGAAWLCIKTEGAIAARARSVGSISAIITAVLFVLAGIVLWKFVDGYRITSVLNTTGPSNPLFKTAAHAPGAWMQNYQQYPWTMAAPILGVLGCLLAAVLIRARKDGLAMITSGLGIAGIILTVGASMFPMILPSSVDPRFSLTVWDSSSSHMTLFIMLVCTAVFIPLIVAYTSWVYSVLWGKVNAKDINDGNGHAY